MNAHTYTYVRTHTCTHIYTYTYKHTNCSDVPTYVVVNCIQPIFSQENYHNVFGYIEDIYKAHEQFWTWTLRPCLDKVQLHLTHSLPPFLSFQLNVHVQH